MKNFISSILAALLTIASCSQAPQETSLKEAYSDSFMVGCAVNPMHTSGRLPQANELILKHFNAISPENCLKPEAVQPRPGEWTFDEADEYVKFGEDNDMWILGHTLVWHNQTPSFYWYNEDGSPKSREELIETMRAHIETVAGRYAGRIDAWDVVNEIIGEFGEYREKGWVKAFGGDGYEVVRNAFIFADRYAPDAELYYNDFNVWRPAHLDGIVTMVKKLQAEGIRIDGVGIQAHWGLNYPKTEYIGHAIDTLHSLGVKVMITEWDISALPTVRQGAEILDTVAYMQAMNPYPDGMPQEAQEAWNERVRTFMDLFLKHEDKITRVTAWGVSDQDSWKNGWPIPGRTDYPLLFDRDLQPKAFLNEYLK